MSHATTSVDRPTGETLSQAAVSAGFAPSILNTQPWRWRLEPGRLELFAERAGQLRVTDPQGRLLTISCAPHCTTPGQRWPPPVGRHAWPGGIPAGALPDHPAQTTVPGRDFGRTGTLPIGPGHDRAAVYALLFGDADGPASWLCSGEALSAAWLTATTLGVSVVPLSDVVEVLYTPADVAAPDRRPRTPPPGAAVGRCRS
jgi:nitroreductase